MAQTKTFPVHNSLANPRGILGLLLTSVVLVSAMLLTPAESRAQVSVGVGISVGFAPPPLPVYEQPICPGPGYIWTPGYWAYDPVDGYYWVPGTWISAPFEGALWTPGFWGWSGAAFVWHIGYWGPVVGFYGGINYGFGYTGLGYFGGYWNNGAFFYNRTVNNVNVTNITNVYNKTVINNVAVNHVSYNGGTGGVAVQPTSAQLAAARSARRVGPTAVQGRQEQAARANPAQRASVNHGAPPVAATARPGALTGGGVVRASRAGGVYRPAPANAAAPRSAIAGASRAPAARGPNPSGGGTHPLITRHAAAPAARASVRPSASNRPAPRTAPTRTVPTRTMPARSAPSRTAPSRTAPSRTEPSRTAPSRTAPSRTEPSRTTASRPQVRTVAPSRPNPVSRARYNPPRRQFPAQRTAPRPAVPQRRPAPSLERAPRSVPQVRSAGRPAAPAPRRAAPARPSAPQAAPAQRKREPQR